MRRFAENVRDPHAPVTATSPSDPARSVSVGDVPTGTTRTASRDRASAPSAASAMRRPSIIPRLTPARAGSSLRGRGGWDKGAGHRPEGVVHEFLSRLGLEEVNSGAAANGFIATKGRVVASIDPATGETIASVRLASRADY